MNNEIERKFLIHSFDTALSDEAYEIKQGYIFSKDSKVVRVRTYNEKAYITVKYRKSKITRAEFEYEIPYSDAIDMLYNCCDGKILEKTRYIYYYCDKKWEIDVFHGENKGIILGEIELESENEEFEIPPFIVTEVTGNPEYSNHNMSKKE